MVGKPTDGAESNRSPFRIVSHRGGQKMENFMYLGIGGIILLIIILYILFR